jgi:uncharacterized membrane protein YheB (UPF0754 family)
VQKVEKTDNDVEGDLTSLTFRDKKAGVPYAKSRVKCPKDLIMDSGRTYKFAEIISQIVNDEGPICVDMLLRRVCELSATGRVGSNILSNFNSAIKLAVKNGDIEKNGHDKDFFYKPNKVYKSFRTPSDGIERRLNEISLVEIKNAIKYLINNQFGLAYDNLIQSVKPLFEIARVNPEEADRMKDIVDEMIENGEVIKHGPLLNILA